ncbi:trissin receptor-like isoform X1 [Mizuhopecten yessoensis]|uniref:Neuropeptide FF receptor 2 n=1 Tax=Mizuhopecten yessoensis TaxID=6573 RepID=A0A210QIN6_MIZYE|nr:trissin receptor-like isoform X1 [Mizuhopecten yessoensis]XP_021357509.1 trissin receptor-like isoform X1 [Mizuhopecten yessoensis]OWF48461.1 Neuropeptide FF receptor 2 [Mizuhopecten yessoensis]
MSFAGIANRTCVPGDPVQPSALLLSMLKYVDAPPLPVKPTWEITLKILFYALSFVVDVVGNVIVVIIIYLNKRMRSTTNILILNLAISDIMVGLFCMWVHLGNQISANWPFGPFICKASTFTQVFAVTSSVLTLTVISIERFFAIVFPLKGKMSQCVMGLSIAVSWLVSAAIAAPQLFVRKVIRYEFKNRDEVFCTEIWPKFYKNAACISHEPGKVIYYTIEGIVMYVIPVIIMIGAYTVIALKLMLRKAPGNSLRSTSSSQDRTRKKVIKMLVAVLVVFVLCWTPQQYFLLWEVFRSHTTKTSKYVPTIKYIAVYFAYLNSAINPILYAGFNENFRRGFTEAFKCSLWRKRNQVTPGPAGRSVVTAFDGSKAGDSSAGVTLNSHA